MKFQLSLFTLIFLCFMICFSGRADGAGTTTDGPKALISIDTRRNCVEYSRMIFGQFIEHFHDQVYGGIFDPHSPLSDKDGFRRDVIEALRELHVPVVRWPGGCFVSAYHWMDGVGPERKSTFDKAWRVEDSNRFGTDEFIAWCKKIGAEPYICANAGTGTPEEMSNWVEYCNLRDEGRYAELRQSNGYADPHHVKYWSIGNENYGWWEMGGKTQEEFGAFALESAKMIRQVDPSVKLFAASNYDLDWTLNLLRKAGEQLDYISIHGYFDRLQSKNEPSDYLTCMTKTIIPEKQIVKTEQLIALAGFEGKIHIAYDEWNQRGWHHPGVGRRDIPIEEMIRARDKNNLNSTYTMADAVFSACFLNTCLRHANTVKMANMSPVVNTRGSLFAHKGGIVRRTTFHVLKMYADLLAPFVVDAQVESDSLTHQDSTFPVVDAVITCDKEKKIFSMMLINKHPNEEAACTVFIDGKELEGVYGATILSGDSPDAYNDVQNPNRVVPVAGQIAFKKGKVLLPAHSITHCRLEYKGQKN